MSTADFALAWDPVRSRPLLYGGSFTHDADHAWELTGNRWNGLRARTSPGRRRGHAMATDFARGEVVLFGASGANGAAETFLYDGADWRRYAGQGPSLRSYAAMTADRARQRVVLFGGMRGVASLGDTWIWDGATWTQAAPVAAPAARYGHRLAFDGVRNRVLLFGGTSSPSSSFLTNSFGDTWGWDGTAWTRLAPAIAPWARAFHGMVQDTARNRIVLYGGRAPNATAGANDTWEWDGVAWRELVAHAVPPVANAIDTVFDAARNRVVLHAGVPTDAGPTTWEWDGIAWTRVAEVVAPPARQVATLTYEPARRSAVLFGGLRSLYLADTWTWDGAAWSLRTPAAQPAARGGHAAAHDPLRARTVMFGGGGQARFSVLGDTWEWDGANWLAANPATAPSARSGHAMAFDPSSQRVILFGGGTASPVTYSDETWAWDGVVWTLLAMPTRPPGRAGAGLVADAAGSLLLFGGGGLPLRAGTNVPTPRADTWQFVAPVWVQRQPAASPPPRWSMGMATDQLRARVVVHGGYDGTLSLADTWQWDGATWAPIATTNVPDQSIAVAMDYDGARQHVVMVGTNGDTWAFGDLGAHAAFGAGCAGALGAPVLVPDAVSVPTLGGRLAARLLGVPNGVAALGVQVLDAQATPRTVPLSLAAFGMPGCDAWIDPSATFGLAVSGTVATWSLDVPWTAALHGAQLVQQALVLDPGANAAGLVVSNAAQARIGI